MSYFNFNFSYLSRFLCCRPSQFETGELFCSGLISKYITQRQNVNLCQPNSAPNLNFGPSYYQRPLNSAPYYYGDIAYQHQQPSNQYWNNPETSKYFAIMDGLRIQLKNQTRTNTQSLRCPSVHRSDEFKVSLRGWLYRLEGAALKQWKRRWCVLADYCLFYYKDMAEEKMLGSLILPSYKISPCFSSDGISRKFSFKAEHSNMKTYYFAADSKEIQQQWMNALSMASIMQLSAIFPSASNGKSANNYNNNVAVNKINSNIEHLESNKMVTENKAIDEESGGFVSYQAKRIDETNNEMMCGINYYEPNYTGTSINLHNSIGLPPIYPDPMYGINGYIIAPPKPQRQYYDSMLPYDLSSPSLADYKLTGPDLINHNYYAEDNRDQYFEENFLSAYPEYFPVNNVNDFQSNYIDRMPPRPHSADFLERHQDEDFDEECQTAFHKEYFRSEANMEPKILPTRPKSSIERYNPYYTSQYFDKSMPFNDEYKHSFEEHDFDPNKENEINSKMACPNESTNYSSTNFIYNYGVTKKHSIDAQQPSGYENSPNGLVPERPPLPQMYKYSAKYIVESPTKADLVPLTKSKLLHSDSNDKDTTYTSDDETSAKQGTSLANSSQTNLTTKNITDCRNDLTEISKEDYYKASQMFYQRQKCRQIKNVGPPVSTESNTHSDCSIQSTDFKVNFDVQSDWNEIGLPLPSSNYLSSQCNTKSIANSVSLKQTSVLHGNENTFIDQLNSSLETNKSDQLSYSSNCYPPGDNPEVKFKLGVKVRTYKKPKCQTVPHPTKLVPNTSLCSKYSVKTLDINPAYEAFVKEMTPVSANSSMPNEADEASPADLKSDCESVKPTSSQEPNKCNKTSTSSAPYYYSDLLTEEQKEALQKKLSNFATPPQLLSRCTALNSTKYLGMTSLSSKAKLDKTDSKSTVECKDKKSNGVGSFEEANFKSNDAKCGKFQNDQSQSNQIEEPQSDLICEEKSKSSKTLSNETKANSLKKVSFLTEHQNTVERIECTKQPQKSVALKSNNSNNLNDLTIEPSSVVKTVSPKQIDSAGETGLKKIRKKLSKRKSKEDVNNVSDSEIHYREEKTRRFRSLKMSKRMCVSAADFIGKSHEELILMLIQFRRRQSELCKSCEKLRLQMESEQKMMEIEPHRREEYNYRFKELKQKLNQVEKEYEFQIPIIESIDSMIKVKSKSKQNELNKKKAASTSLLDKMSCDNLNRSDGSQHQGSLENSDEEYFAVSSSKTLSTPATPNENIENLKKQQKVLEGELDRVRGMLTHSTKKLEEKAVENAQMEQEMLIARSKLKQVLDNEQEAMELTRSSKLEAELAQINKVIDDLHSRRKELNSAIENLKCSDVKNAKYLMHLNTLNLGKHNLQNSEFDSTMLNSDTFAQYKDDLIYPLYENLNAQRSYKPTDEFFINKKSVFDQVNNNVNVNDNENDEFFTLNINLNKSKHYNGGSTSLDSSSEINNNELQQMTSMCEFDPTKDIPAAYGDSIVDQQIKQIYNYQSCAYPSFQKSNEIRTVREVKRESERRKFNLHQQQNYKLSNPFKNDHKLNYDQTYYITDNHFYKESIDFVDANVENDQDNVEDLDDILLFNHNTNQTKLIPGLNDDLNRNSYNAPDIVQSTIKLNEDYFEKQI